MPEQSFHKILEQCFLRRKSINKRYSQRAFARDLEMEPSQLTRVLRGERNISPEKARWVAERLFESMRERELFMLLVESSASRTRTLRSDAKQRLKNFKSSSDVPNISLDKLSFLSSWMNVALLDLLALQSYGVKDAGRMGRLLGISSAEAKSAVEVLLKGGLARVKNGRLEKVESSLWASSVIPSETIRALHRQFIQKAMESIDCLSMDKRYLTSKTIALNKSDLMQIRSMIDDLNRKLSEIAGKPSRKGELYQFNTQFFSLLREGFHEN